MLKAVGEFLFGKSPHSSQRKPPEDHEDRCADKGKSVKRKVPIPKDVQAEKLQEFPQLQKELSLDEWHKEAAKGPSTEEETSQKDAVSTQRKRRKQSGEGRIKRKRLTEVDLDGRGTKKVQKGAGRQAVSKKKQPQPVETDGAGVSKPQPLQKQQGKRKAGGAAAGKSRKKSSAAAAAAGGSGADRAADWQKVEAYWKSEVQKARAARASQA